MLGLIIQLQCIIKKYVRFMFNAVYHIDIYQYYLCTVC